ncbi:MAG: diguanylate cyclase [Geobacter sp.]|nr:diguanylate cyclase [Geobacter sp.]
MLKSRTGSYMLPLFVCIVSCLVWLTGYIFLRHERDTHVALNLAKQTAAQEIAWKAVTVSHRHTMDAYFQTYVMKPEVLELLKAADTSDAARKNVVRAKLYRLLYPTYEQLSQQDIRQFHFHTSDNRSFLRFHAPHNSGDSLADTRPSVVMANSSLKPVHTFETGRIMVGFRNVFPIVWNGKHLGSVEFSQPFEAIRREMHTLDPGCEYLLTVHDQAMLPKLFEEYKGLFAPARFSREWLVEDPQRQLPDSPPPLSPSVQAVYERLGTSKDFMAQLASGNAGSIALRQGSTAVRVTMLPLNDAKGSSKAVLLAFSRSPELDEIYFGHRLHLAMFSVMLLLVGIAFYLFLRSVQTVRKQEQHLRLIADTMDDSLYVMDKDGTITFVNQAAAHVLGLTGTDLMGKIAHYLFHHHGSGEKTPLTDCPIYKVIHAGERYKGEEWFCRADGSPFMVEVASQPMLQGRKVIGSVTVFRDITERKRLESQLTLLSVTDPLTGAFNRRHFLQALEAELHRADRYGTPFSLVMLDVDRFKRVNDSCGHEAGDRVLQEMVKLIRGRIRSSDILARWGGEEFLLLLVNTPLEAAATLAETLLTELRGHEIEGVGTVTASLGVTCHLPEDSADTLLIRVDQLMYQAKASGRDCMCVAAHVEPSPIPGSRSPIEWAE